MEFALEVKGLRKTYKEFGLKNISMKLPKGCVLGLIGENGAGKSTLINAILGLIECDYESLRIFGQEYAGNEKQIKEEIAVIFDKTCYDLNFTPLFIGKILSNVYSNWDMEKYHMYLDRFELPKKKKLKEFSKGMKMKMEFAAALSHDPKLLILDEATSGLDPVFRDEILDILREYTEDEEQTILMSSHITSDLDKISDYIAFIHDGELLFTKTYDELQENYGVLNCGQRIFDALNREDIEAYRKDTYGYRVLVNNKQGIRKVFSDLEIEQATIEDVMLYCVRGEKVA